MAPIVVSKIAERAADVEIVERKGLGHPDTICDVLAESFSRNLCREYRARFGEILHYNVDKALLCGGRALPAFGGGQVLAPIEIILAGRATSEVDGKAIPVEEIAIEGSRAWLRENMHGLDVERHVRISCRVAPGSPDLRALFSHNSGEAPPGNDTSIGVGYWPLSPLELFVLDVEHAINSRVCRDKHPAWGEDVKVMGVRQGERITLTVACAFIGRYLRDLEEYVAEKKALVAVAINLGAARGLEECNIVVNAADDIAQGDVYLTVTGTSAESGDDGEVGRGNRANGLITPCRPMSLEALAGKNPRNHVGKLYNVLANRISQAIVSEIPEVKEAHCLLVSQIGRPITEPSLAQIQIALADQRSLPTEQEVRRVAAQWLERVTVLTDAFAAGDIPVC